MAMFWQSYLDMVQILLDFVKSIRLPDWNLHLQSTERMLVWIHAYDTINYARHFSYYCCTQQKIQNKFPTIYQEFQHGNFSTRRTKGKFNMLPPDQVIEQTINKDQKGPGGIIGISTSQGSIQSWVLSSHNTATLIADLRKGLNLDTADSTTKDLNSKRIRFDENAVNKCYELINSWTNPFTETSNIFCLSSGMTSCYEVQHDLLEAQKIGQACLETFITERIETNNIDFYAPIKKNCLQTFEKEKKTVRLNISNQKVAIRADRETFARLLLIQQKHRVNLREVLAYELGPLPLSISNYDGSLRKTQKSKLFQHLESSIVSCVAIPENCPQIFDGMVLLQKLPKMLKTFGDISDYILKKVLRGPARAAFFVTDYYLEDSIKSMEWDSRSTHGTIRMKVVRRKQAIPKQWKKFLRNSENKLDLIDFLLYDWSTNSKHSQLLDGKEFYMTIRDEAHCISLVHGVISCDRVQELSSIQEEADTKIFLCAKFAASLGFESVSIITVDSDVAILSMYYQHRLDLNIFLQMGTGSKEKIFDIQTNELSVDVINALPAVHALSGCDSTSSLSGIGKVKFFKTVCKDERYYNAASILGESETINDTVVDVLEELFCDVYGAKDEIDINSARYMLFSKLKKVSIYFFYCLLLSLNKCKTFFQVRISV